MKLLLISFLNILQRFEIVNGVAEVEGVAAESEGKARFCFPSQFRV